MISHPEDSAFFHQPLPLPTPPWKHGHELSHGRPSPLLLDILYHNSHSVGGIFQPRIFLNIVEQADALTGYKKISIKSFSKFQSILWNSWHSLGTLWAYPFPSPCQAATLYLALFLHLAGGILVDLPMGLLPCSTAQLLGVRAVSHSSLRLSHRAQRRRTQHKAKLNWIESKPMLCDFGTWLHLFGSLAVASCVKWNLK